LFLAAFRIRWMISKIVTIRDPKAIDPRESVEARPKALRFGCLG
jgi:hypothetical protein